MQPSTTIDPSRIDLSSLQLEGVALPVEVTATSLRETLMHASARFEGLFDQFFDAFTAAFPKEEGLEKSDILDPLMSNANRSYDVTVLTNDQGIVGGAISYVLGLTNENGSSPLRDHDGNQIFGAHVSYLFVNEKDRFQGYGRTLDYCVEQQARECGASFQFLESIDHHRAKWPKYRRTQRREKEHYLKSHLEGGSKMPLTIEGRNQAWSKMGYQLPDSYMNVDGYDSPYNMLVRFYDGLRSEMDAGLFLAAICCNSSLWDPSFVNSELYKDIRLGVGGRDKLPLLSPTDALTCVRELTLASGSNQGIPIHLVEDGEIFFRNHH